VFNRVTLDRGLKGGDTIKTRWREPLTVSQVSFNDMARNLRILE
jgi:hypothetical protein